MAANLYLLSAAVNFTAALMSWFRYPVLEEVRKFSVILLLTALWLLVSFFELVISTPSTQIILLSIDNAIGILINILLFLMILSYYHGGEKLKDWQKKSIGILLAVILLLNWADAYHLLTGAEVMPGPLDSHIIYFEHSPLFQPGNILNGGLIMLSIIILCYKIKVSDGAARRLAGPFLLALASIFFSFLFQTFVPNQEIGNIVTPIGYALSGLCLSWMMIARTNMVIVQQTNALQTKVNALTREIETRKSLETQLREVRDDLSNRLTAQSINMAGVYDLILLTSEAHTPKEILESTLIKIQDILGCSALFYYNQDNRNHLILESAIGLSQPIPAPFCDIPSEWITEKKHIGAVVNIAADTHIPSVFSEHGYTSAQFKSVMVRERIFGFFIALWSDEKLFSVEDIVLFNGISNGLGFIFENSLLRSMAEDSAKHFERQRLARDLHDSVTQSLHSLTLSAETAVAQAETNPLHLKITLNHIVVSARQALKEMRLLLYELRLSKLSETNLVEVIRTRLEAVERRAGIEARFVVSKGFYISKPLESELYPLVIETLNNALKHAHAKQVDIHFTKEEDQAIISIADNGIGFILADVIEGGMGLKNIQDRCTSLGATLIIDTQPGQGTKIVVNIPTTEKQGNI